MCRVCYVPSLLWAEVVMCRVVPKSKKRVYLSKKKNIYIKKKLSDLPTHEKRSMFPETRHLFIYLLFFFCCCCCLTDCLYKFFIKLQSN